MILWFSILSMNWIWMMLVICEWVNDKQVLHDCFVNVIIWILAHLNLNRVIGKWTHIYFIFLCTFRLDQTFHNIFTTFIIELYWNPKFNWVWHLIFWKKFLKLNWKNLKYEAFLPFLSNNIPNKITFLQIMREKLTSCPYRRKKMRRRRHPLFSPFLETCDWREICST